MLIASNQISQGKHIPPEGQHARISKIIRNRQLYDNEQKLLGVTNRTLLEPLKVNWFRRIATFFPEFMFGERPVITTDNERFNEILNSINLVDAMHFMNIDALRYGTGVLASDPFDPLTFRVYQPDQWYTVVDPVNRNIIKEDILVYKTGMNIVKADPERYVVIRYPVDDKATFNIYKANASALGSREHSQDLPARMGRQVVNLYHGYATDFEGISIYEDTQDAIGELSRVSNYLSATIKRNSRPHLTGPQGMVRINDDGSVNLDEEGEFLPLEKDDPIPQYVQWDSKEAAIQYDYESQQNIVYDMAGLSKLLFDNQSYAGQITGIALKRLMIPFVSKLNDLTERNEGVIKEAILMFNSNLAAQGVEVFNYNNVEVEWLFERIFEDEPVNAPVDNG